MRLKDLIFNFLVQTGLVNHSIGTSKVEIARVPYPNKQKKGQNTFGDGSCFRRGVECGEVTALYLTALSIKDLLLSEGYYSGTLASRNTKPDPHKSRLVQYETYIDVV